MKQLLNVLIIAVLLLVSCSDPFMNQLFVTESDDATTITNAAWLEEHKADFSLWIDLLHYADLYNALNDASTKTTVFAPNNEAMKAFMTFKNITSFEELGVKYAREVVKAHILRNTSLSESNFMVYVKAGSIPVPNVFGTYLTTSYGYLNNDVDDAELPGVKPQDTLTIYLNNQASVLERAHATSNGMVYVLGGVIRPLTETVVQKLKDYGEYKLFVEAIEKTGWDSALNVIADTTYALNGSFSVNAVNYTCFAVPDHVFSQQGIQTLADLKSLLQAGDNLKDSTNALNRYIGYHVLDRIMTRNNLLAFDKAGDTRVFDTKLRYQVITTDDSTKSINQQYGFIRSDRFAKNGIIHKIDGIMPVWEPKPVTVIWDFCNSSDVISIVNAYGAANSYGNLFTSAIDSKEYQVDLSEDMTTGNYGKASSFTYTFATSATSYGSWKKVGFLKCKWASTSTPTVNSYKAYMNNLFVLNLGYTGSIKMKTPTIIKGKYKVEFAYAATAALQSFYPAGSMVRFTLDDYLKQLYVWKGITLTTSHIRTDVLYDEVNFEHSVSHDLKAVMMDIKASTNFPYRQMWDYIKFTPIN